jgi:hypothetical protein
MAVSFYHRASRAEERLHHLAAFLLVMKMPIRETKKMMRTIVAIGVAVAFLAVFAMLMIEFPPS